MSNVQLLPGNEISADMVLEADCSLIGVATGAVWRDDGIGRYHREPLQGLGAVPAYTPDDIMAGRLPEGRVVLFDDDHYYMGGVIAEKLVAHGCEVVFVTTESLVSAYTQNTSEQATIQRRMLESCAEVRTSTVLRRIEPGAARLACVFTGRETTVAADALVLVTGSVPRDELYQDLERLDAGLREKTGIRRVVRVGDCLGPGTLAAAVYSGHLFARTLDTGLTDWTPFRRENVELGWDQPLPPGSERMRLLMTETTRG